MRFFAILIAVSFFASCSGSASSGGKDLIVVLDTSMSMVGKGGKNILPQVKESLNRFVDKLDKGDTFTFVSFDETTKIYPTIEITSVAKTDVIKKYISVVEARGLWTYTMDMLSVVVAKARELNSVNPDRKVMIVILTDALDDPPPSLRKKQLNIKDIAKGDPADWFVYFVNLGDVSENAKLKALSGDVAANIAKNSSVVDSKGDAQKVIDENLTKALADVDKEASKTALLKVLLALLPLLLLLIIGFIIYMIRKSALKVLGFVELRPADHPKAELQTFDLSVAKAATVTIGRNQLDTIRLTSFEDRKPLIFTAKRFQKAIKVVLDDENGTQVQFVRDKKEAFLVDGDSFVAGGYLFIYRESVD